MFNVWESMIREESRGKLISILAELKETKFANSHQVFRLDIDVIKSVTSLIGYEHFVEGVFQRKHLLKHPEHGIKTFVYEIDLLNFLLETIEKKLNE